MSYRIGFDGVASAELAHLLRGVQHALNTRGTGMLTQMKVEETAASVVPPVDPCAKYTKECGQTKGPTEPPHIIVVTAIVVVVTLLIGLAVGYRLGKFSMPGR